MPTLEATNPTEEMQFHAPNQELLPDELPLPPLQEGFVRLYRGDVVNTQGQPVVERIEGRNTAAETAGRWFTDDPNAAEGYGSGRVQSPDGEHPRTRFIDVPADVAHTYNTRNLTPQENKAANGTGGNSEEWLLPADIATQAHEYQVKQVEQMYEPEVETGLREVLTDSTLVSVLKSMQIDTERVDDIIKNKATSLMVIEQLSIYLGQGEKSAHSQDLLLTLNELHRGVSSAHKQRYIGAPPVVEESPTTPVESYEDTGEW